MITISDHLRQTVLQTIQDDHMFQPADSILVGVSGGPDSVSLLHILLCLSESRNWRIGVAHLDHGLRPGFCETDARFVESICRNLHLPCYVSRADVQEFRRQHRLSLEEAGRNLRYDFLEHTASLYGFNRIALGHQADDNAESVLMYLFRGSGMTGLSGIPPIRNRIVRPLIRVRRSELIQFLLENHLPCVKDDSNADVRFTRNRIRQTILPLVQSTINSNVVHTLNRLSGILRSENDWIETLVQNYLASCKTGQGPGYVHLSVAAVQSFHPAARRRIIRQAILEIKGNLKKISFIHIEALLGLISNSSHDGEIHLPDRIRGIRHQHDLQLRKQTAPLRSPSPRPIHFGDTYHYQIGVPSVDSSVILDIAETGVRLIFAQIDSPEVRQMDFLSANHAFLDMESLVFPLTVRPIMPGDRFKPLGMQGFQKVKKFFIDHQIDSRQRRICPVVISGNRIAWICGHRIDEDFRLKTSTRRILKITLQF